jgi:hypothetical protein
MRSISTLTAGTRVDANVVIRANRAELALVSDERPPYAGHHIAEFMSIGP